MTFQDMQTFNEAERSKPLPKSAFKNRRGVSRETAAHVIHENDYVTGRKKRETYHGPQLNGDVRSGWNAVNGEWWRNGSRIHAPPLKNLYK